ncbi:IDEAL domain-containing protein [Paenibacillus sp. ACRRX]|uniref:IDEAL domain-containing protein n=1 Tax=Paenibacillus TaxID=44249 RepID=UPI00041BCFE3|nr:MULTISPECIES: IDEAL domain-containing protein [Paenibacillus]MCG7406471.1 IDEAL domain-containing protein [Paenibacillus sp. ACRRX]MDK8179503.1 IDEAL domain-containing protein [Paenibacillus sp. UMB4589-SE434]
MDKMKVSYEVMLGLTAEMIWDDAIRKHRTRQIYVAIDEALATGDEASFQMLTNELKTLQ